MGTEDTEEDSEVTDPVVLAVGYEHQSDEGDGGLGCDDWGAHTLHIGETTDSEGDDGGDAVGWGRVVQGVGGVVSHSCEDGGEEVGEGVYGEGGSHEAESPEPELEVGAVVEELLEGEGVVL